MMVNGLTGATAAAAEAEAEEDSSGSEAEGLCSVMAVPYRVAGGAGGRMLEAEDEELVRTTIATDG